jgi:hypothetical protein
MRNGFLLAAALVLLSGGAFGQQTMPPAANGPQNSAVNTSNKPTPSAPVAGSNSFTKGEAQSRIEAKGFTDIADLQKDDKGVWRAHAKQAGRTVTVSLDYQGNVVAR